MDNKNKGLISYFENRLNRAKENRLMYINQNTGEILNMRYVAYYDGCIHEIKNTIDSLKEYNNH